MSEPLNIHSVWEIDLESANALNDLDTFLAEGGDPNEIKHVNGYSQSFIYKATGARNIKAVELLARFGANVDLTGNEPMSFGSALLLASELGCVEICNLLIEYGADVNMHYRGTLLPGTLNIAYPDTSALHRAAEKGHSAVVNLLIGHGANPDILVEPVPFLMNLRYAYCRRLHHSLRLRCRRSSGRSYPSDESDILQQLLDACLGSHYLRPLR